MASSTSSGTGSGSGSFRWLGVRWFGRGVWLASSELNDDCLVPAGVGVDTLVTQPLIVDERGWKAHTGQLVHPDALQPQSIPVIAEAVADGLDQAGVVFRVRVSVPVGVQPQFHEGVGDVPAWWSLSSRPQ